MTWQIGDRVTIRPEFREPGEPAHVHEIMSAPDALGRVQIAPADWPWQIRPIELVASHMIEPC